MKSLFNWLLVAASIGLGPFTLAGRSPPIASAGPTNGLATNSAAEADVRVGGYVLDDKHKLAPGDKISFRIIEDRDPAVSLMVTDSGELDTPYVGRIKVTGKTCKQLAGELKGLLEQEYYYRASVVIGLDAVSKIRGKVYIWGQVRNQGAIEIPSEENFTAGKAILRAGGFGDFANKRKVKLIRTNPDGTKQEPIELNMEEILEKGKTEKDKTLQEDDFIIVPERLINL
jgi:protein involved in polysaccharide export with SLBB domain